MELYDTWIQSISSQLTSRELSEIIVLLEKHYPKRRGKRGESVALVFESLRSDGDGKRQESLLFDQNVPPLELDVRNAIRSAWLEVSYAIFSLNPRLSPDFSSRLLNVCITKPSPLAFALSHSDSVSITVKNNVSRVDFRDCLRVLKECADTRSLYALKAIRWYGVWNEVQRLVFEFLFSDESYLKNAAYWVLMERSEVEGLKMLASDRGLTLSEEVRDASDKVTMLQSIVKSGRSSANKH